MRKSRWAILGTVGVPGNYGGFETLAENLVRLHESGLPDTDLTVYCSRLAFKTHPARYLTANLRYIGLKANGLQSVPYDIVSLFDAARRGTDVILLLGVSGALALPFLRLFSRSRIVTNIDGIEWKREKWRGLARWVLRWSEWSAVRWSHAVIADNQAIAEHVRTRYGVDCHVIAYGGDHAISATPVADPDLDLPQAFSLSLCRIEPENNVGVILDAFSKMPERNLVFVGNWDNSDYGKDLRKRYGTCPNITLLNPIYDPGRLRDIRGRATSYIHGHSAGGTNPSLVEMMHFGILIHAYDCSFNRYSTQGEALYFKTSEELIAAIRAVDAQTARAVGLAMQQTARQLYLWDKIGRAYFALIRSI